MNHSWRVRENQNKSSELYHHGIKGMKWGVRRTPEQLGHKRTHKRLLKGKPLKYVSPGYEQAKHILSNVGEIAVSLLVPGGAFVVRNRMNRLYDAYMDTTNYPKGNEKLSELKRKPEGSKMSIMDDVKKVNNTGKKGYVMNCFNCVCALEMRQRGYDVKALPSSIGATDDEFRNMFDFKGKIHSRNRNEIKKSRDESKNRKDFVNKSYTQLCKDLESSNPEGARGFLGFSYESTNVGHVISWKIENGDVNFYDPQSGKRASEILALSNQDYTWGRLDNVKVSNKITERIKSREDG